MESGLDTENGKNSTNRRNSTGSAILSYFLSLVYLFLKWLFPGSNITDLIFIFIHLFFVLLGIFLFLWIYIVVGIAFISRKMKSDDKNKVKLIMKTAPDRMGLALLYWLLPIGLYAYNIVQVKILYLFVWLPIWYPIMYFFIEKRIKAKEKKLNSPVVNEYDSTTSPLIQDYSIAPTRTKIYPKPQIKSRFWGNAIILAFLFAFLAFGIFAFAAISKSAERQGLSVYQLFFDNKNSATAKFQKLTADWKTYFNGYYVLEIRYPKSGWAVFEEMTQEKGGFPINIFALRSDNCQTALEPSGGRGLGDEWILEDQPVTIDGRIYKSRLFYLGDKNHLKWVSVYSFPNWPAADLVLRSDQESKNDIDSECLNNFRRILRTIRFFK